MTNLIFRIVGIIITVIIIVLSYSLISWNIFGHTTFLSGGKDCRSSTNTDVNKGIDIIKEKTAPANSFFRDGSLFGEYCSAK